MPLFTVALGSETPIRDLELSDLLVDDVVFVDDVVNFEFKLTATGYAGRAVQITLHERGKDVPLASLRRRPTPTASRKSCGCLTGQRRSASSSTSSKSSI